MSISGFLSRAERVYLFRHELEIRDGIKPGGARWSAGYERVLRHRIRKKASYAIGELTLICLSAPELAPELTYDDAILFSLLFQREAQRDIVKDWVSDEHKKGYAKLRRAWRRASPEAARLRGHDAEDHFRVWLQKRVIRGLEEEDRQREKNGRARRL